SGTPLDDELHRLVRKEGFTIAIGHWETRIRFRKANFRSARQLRDALRGCSQRQWAGFQLYYPMPEREVRACTGRDLMNAITAAFAAVVPSMNCCMQAP